MAVPSMWLVARLIRELTINYTPIIFSYDGFQLIDEEDDSYWWIKWVLSAIIVTLLVMLVFHWQEIGRGILQFPSEGIFSALGQAQFTTFRASLVWFIVTIMFLAVGYFLSASVCGHINTLQGFGLGLVLLMLGSGIGTGWNVAVVNATNPYELWNNTNITEDAYDLRTTLLEIADRDTRGFPLIDLKIVRDESAGITDNGIVAWLVRDFQNAEFVDSLEDAKREEIVLMSIIDEEPDLDGSYVGQSFLIREKWTIRNLRFGEWISWFSQRRVRATETLQDRIILWLRIDVYDDIPAQERIRG
jgi:hypothetical protein